MTGLPSGTATFLFTDIEGSTKLVHELGDAFDALLETHRSLLRKAFEANGGHEIGTEGDSFFVVFARATDALRAAVDGQRALTAHGWPGDRAIRVRMGMHTGEARLVANDYVGLAVHQAARVSSAANGGQILISDATRALVQDDLPADVRLENMGQHQLKDLPRAETLFQVNHPELPADFTPIRSLDARRHNLPTQLTTFIGRESDLADVRKLIASNRLVTLTGAGGCGKTRLALEAAADVLGEFTDGVRLVDLAPVTDPELVPQTVVSALGLREQEGRSIESTLEDYFAIKDMLLILDNCEHLVDPAADLVERLLKLATDLRILVTTREPLGVDGETAWRVPSLDAPDPRDARTEDLHRSQAIRLFIDRAASVDPDFAPADDDMKAIAQICYRLDGIPLAIELAAARMDVLTPPQIVERLNDRFRLLTGGRRSALARQQTLQALVDWSYDLLDDHEQTLLERASVFAGTFSLEAGEAICADDKIPATDVLDVLSQLVRKSLLIVEKRSGQARYRMLETIKQYGRDKLFASPDAITIRTRHSDYFIAFAERMAEGFIGSDQKKTLDTVGAEDDNLRAALEWSMSESESDNALRFSYALWQYWRIGGYWTEARAWYDQILAAYAGTSDGLRARVECAAAFFAAQQRDTDTTHALVKRCLPITDAHGDRATRGYALWSLLYTETDRLREQWPSELDEVLSIAHETNDNQLEVWTLLLQGSFLADPGRRTTKYREGLAAARKAGDLWSAAMALNNLGTAAAGAGSSEEAEQLLHEAVALWRELGEVFGLAQALVSLAYLAARKGDRAQASAFASEGARLAKQVGARPVAVSGLNYCAWDAHLDLQDAEGLPHAEESVKLVESLPAAMAENFRGAIYHTLGEIERALGYHERAERSLTTALLSSRTERTRGNLAASLDGLAGLAIAQDRLADAARRFGAAEALREACGAENESPEIYERDVASLKAKMDAGALTAEWAIGRTKTDAIVDELAQAR